MAEIVEQLEFEFVGTTSKGIAVDPREYLGLTVPQITGALLKELQAIAPDVHYFSDDFVTAAHQIYGAANRA